MARQYRRKSNGQFGSGATTVKQDRAKHQAVKTKQKDKLNIVASSGGRKKLKVRGKAKGQVVKTGHARRTAERSRKRFG